MKGSYPLNINQDLINSEDCVKLLGVAIDSKANGKHTRQKSK